MTYSFIEVLQLLGSELISPEEARKLLKVDEVLKEGDN